MGHLKQITAICLISILCSFSLPVPARAEWQAAVEYQKMDGDQALNTVKVDWWVTDRVGLRGSLDFGDTGLSTDLLYRQANDQWFTPYLGLGVRDLLDHSGNGLSTGERLELIAGLELKLTNKLALAAETRFVPVNREHYPELKPVIGFSLKWLLDWGSKSGPVEQVTDEATYLLAKLITAEAAGEPYRGQVAVGAVVINRLRSPDFPHTIREIIYQEGQFSCLPKLPSTRPTTKALRAAKAALAGADPSRGALFYYNPVTCRPEARPFFNSPKLTVTTRIGRHVFLKPVVIEGKK